MYLIPVLALAAISPAPRHLLAAEAAATTIPTAAFEEVVVELRINEQDSQEMLVILRDADGAFWIDAADLARLRLKPPRGAPIERAGKRYVPLSAFGGSVRFDAALAMLFAELPATAFETIRLEAPLQREDALAPAANGVFFNYQVYGQRVAGQDSGGALTELGMFSRFGVATSSLAARHTDGVSKATRLDTAFSRDIASRLQTLTVGDSISDPGSFGSSLRFAGVKFEKNFSIRPDLITAPLLIASGTAVVPSSVDVFVNNQKVLQSDVQPGPFIIDNLPAVTGSGDVRLVVRDATGREQVIVQPFYSSPMLLARGLNQYSFSLGRVRENFAQRSFDYGGWTGSGTWRRGLTQGMTLAGHAEFLQGDAWGAGVEWATRAANLGLISLTTAAGGNSTHSGWLAGLAFEHQANIASFSLNASYATDGFRRIGAIDSDATRQKLRGAVQLSLALGRLGNMALAVAQQTNQDDSRSRTLSLGHSVRAGRQGYLNLSVFRSVDARKATSAYLTYTQSFGQSRTLAVGAEGGRGFGATPEELRASLAQPTPVGEGHGWRAAASRSGDYDAWWQQRMRAADVELQATRTDGQNGQSLQVKGAVSWLAGSWRAARSVDGSFALVDVAGLPDVPVYLENHLVARTDERGRAVLPNLLSYQSNRITIDPMDLPLDTAIDSRTLVVRPAFRSGVVARFPVQRINPGVFRLVLPDNTPVPAGAEVQLNGGVFPVALDGFTYVTTLDHGTAGTARWSAGRCVFRIEPPPGDDPMPDMGVIVCRPSAEGAQ
jgi:outer membrane usher protein